MARLIFEGEGVRGRSIKLYDTKCIIATKPSVGSFITGNVSDGEKTIFLTDVVGVQFKRSGNLIGYLQLETASAQMNNQSSNMFSENTFTFENNVNGINNDIMERVYNYVCDRLEELKYGSPSAESRVVLNLYVPPQPVLYQQAPLPPAPVVPAANGWQCPNCRSFNAPDSRFCTTCGTPMA